MGSQVSWGKEGGVSSSCLCTFPSQPPHPQGSILFQFSSVQTFPICERSFQLRMPLGSTGYTSVVTDTTLTLVLSSTSMLLIFFHIEEHIENYLCTEVTEGHWAGGSRCSSPTQLSQELREPQLLGNTFQALIGKLPSKESPPPMVSTTFPFPWGKKQKKGKYFPRADLAEVTSKLFHSTNGSLMSLCRDWRLPKDAQEYIPGPHDK